MTRTASVYPVWPALGGVLLLLGLLFVFQRVVAEGVVQGELRRSATAARADGLWRCRLISGVDERRLCLAQMARFKRPKQYRLVDALPRNNYGKVLKTALREPLADPVR